MTTQTFTATDVAEFAELLLPALASIAPHASSLQEAVEAAVDATRRGEQDAMGRLLPKAGTIAKLLSGTYDEFRAEG